LRHVTALPRNMPRIVQSEHPHTPQPRNRLKEYLTDAEMAVLLKAATQGRHGVRDHCLVLLAWRHGLRVSELVGLTLVDVDLTARQIQVRRLKGSTSTHHDLLPDEVKAVKAWLKLRGRPVGLSPLAFFLTERGEPFTRYGINYLLKAIGSRAGFPFPCYPHMLRHSCGFHLGEEGRDAFRVAGYLGHKNVHNSQRYVHTSAAQFRGIWGEG
jgi:type 1 fimbriae regulatory protein FimB